MKPAGTIYCIMVPSQHGLTLYVSKSRQCCVDRDRAAVWKTMKGVMDGLARAQRTWPNAFISEI